MKILKPGKVEMRKLTCPKCGCVFVASPAEMEENQYGVWVVCPQNECQYNFRVCLDTSEPYEEPYEEPVEDNRERLAQLLAEAMFSTNNLGKQADYLIANGVTFREV